MGWLKVEVGTSKEAAEALSAALLDLSPSGVQIDEKDDVVVLTVYPPETIPVDDICIAVAQAFTRIGLQGLETAPGSVTIISISDEDWVENYKKFFKPIRVGRLLIRPSWEDVESTPGEVVIQLDPGLAFGTGSHPTTRGCLVFLQEEISGGEAVFDLGTGSGILAIAAAKLGAGRVIAIDNDEQAIEVAKRNARNNGVSDKIEFYAAELGWVEPVEADILVANLTAPLIIGIIPGIKEKLKGLKTFIASGITVQQKNMVIESLEEHGHRVDNEHAEGEWVVLVSKTV